MLKRPALATATAALAAVAGVAALPAAGSAHGPAPDHGHPHGSIRHVVLISVDGLHQSDLRWFIGTSRSPNWPRWSPAAPSTRTPRPRSPLTRSPG
jgi:hypothetical protein